uniref:Cytochrome b5 heme-binding domain-containing protein n=1 Tax=Arcella intermedia TaxID=1963864 RepID=A0A6B2LTL4_9EUKA
MKVFSRNEVVKHDKTTDGWVIIDGKVYNVTTWLPYHPGGEEIIEKLLGKDATTEFNTSMHSYQAYDKLDTLHIGYVKENRRFTVLTPAPFVDQLGELYEPH